MGVTRVRSLLDQGKISPATFVYPTSKWLSDKDREAKAQADALQSEQTGFMKRNSAAAERQATAAFPGCLDYCPFQALIARILGLPGVNRALPPAYVQEERQSGDESDERQHSRGIEWPIGRHCVGLALIATRRGHDGLLFSPTLFFVDAQGRYEVLVKG